MKNTPRKNQLQFKPKDVQRFATYLALRCSFVLVSIVLVGWMGAASTLRGSGRSLGQRFVILFIYGRKHRLYLHALFILH